MFAEREMERSMVRKETVAPDLEKVDAVEHARGQSYSLMSLDILIGGFAKDVAKCSAVQYF